jgi:hypothetical protein
LSDNSAEAFIAAWRTGDGFEDAISRLINFPETRPELLRGLMRVLQEDDRRCREIAANITSMFATLLGVKENPDVSAVVAGLIKKALSENGPSVLEELRTGIQSPALTASRRFWWLRKLGGLALKIGTPESLTARTELMEFFRGTRLIEDMIADAAIEKMSTEELNSKYNRAVSRCKKRR